MTAAHGTRARCGDRADVSIGVRTSARARRCAHLCVRPWVRACGDPSPERDAGRWAVSARTHFRDSSSPAQPDPLPARTARPHRPTTHPSHEREFAAEPQVAVSFIYRVSRLFGKAAEGSCPGATGVPPRPAARSHHQVPPSLVCNDGTQTMHRRSTFHPQAVPARQNVYSGLFHKISTRKGGVGAAGPCPKGLVPRPDRPRGNN